MLKYQAVAFAVANHIENHIEVNMLTAQYSCRYNVFSLKYATIQ